MKLVFLLFFVCSVHAVRIKDVAQLEGLSETQLVGYGLVVGLNGSGDGVRTQFTALSVINMLRTMGIEIPDESTQSTSGSARLRTAESIRLRNVAAVMVTANMKPYVKPGTRFDVSLSSLGDARSLEGGTLLMTPLQGPDLEIYALAQGAVSTGGLSAGSRNNSASSRKNHVLVGQIPGGGIVQVEHKFERLGAGDELRYSLRDPDFSSAVSMATSLNELFPGSARAEDAASVLLRVPPEYRNNLMAFIAQAEKVDFKTSTVAKVILNEKTGTVVAGAGVRIAEVAVSHGSVTIQVESPQDVSQPGAFSGGKTVVTNNEKVSLTEDKPDMKVLPQVGSVGQLSQALNSLGVSPRDIIAIFQAIKKAGALHAELVIM